MGCKGGDGVGFRSQFETSDQDLKIVIGSWSHESMSHQPRTIYSEVKEELLE